MSWSQRIGLSSKLTSSIVNGRTNSEEVTSLYQYKLESVLRGPSLAELIVDTSPSGIIFPSFFNYGFHAVSIDYMLVGACALEERQQPQPQPQPQTQPQSKPQPNTTFKKPNSSTIKDLSSSLIKPPSSETMVVD